MASDPTELTSVEKTLVEHLLQKVTKGQCPRCQSKSYEFKPFDATTPMFVLYCKNCGFKMEHFVDFLLDDNTHDSDSQEGESNVK